MNLRIDTSFPYVHLKYAADYGRQVEEVQQTILEAPRGRIQDTGLCRAIGSIYRRAFDGAEVVGADGVDVGQIAETVVTWGHYVAEIQVDGGNVQVVPRWPSDVKMKADGKPRSFYFGKRRVDPDAVVWVRFMSDLAGQGPISGQETPWYRSHWDRSTSTVAAYLNAVRYLIDEMGIPAMRLLPGDSMADLSTADDSERIKETWNIVSDKFRGRLAVVPNRHTAARPSTTLDPNRYGPEVGQWTFRAFLSLQEQLATLCGVPMAIFGQIMDAGTDVVEAHRLFRRHTLQPVANRIAMELTDKLDREVRIQFPEANAGDVRMRAAAFKALTEGGMSVDDARKEAGL